MIAPVLPFSVAEYKALVALVNPLIGAFDTIIQRAAVLAVIRAVVADGVAFTEIFIVDEDAEIALIGFLVAETYR